MKIMLKKLNFLHSQEFNMAPSGFVGDEKVGSTQMVVQERRMPRTRHAQQLKGKPRERVWTTLKISYEIVNLATIHVLLAVVTFYVIVLDKRNVVIAFLHGLLDEEIHMMHPKGF